MTSEYYESVLAGHPTEAQAMCVTVDGVEEDSPSLALTLLERETGFQLDAGWLVADPSTVDRRRIAAERAVRVIGVTEQVVTEALRLLRSEQPVPTSLPYFACISADLAVLAVWRSFPGDALVISALKNIRQRART